MDPITPPASKAVKGIVYCSAEDIGKSYARFLQAQTVEKDIICDDCSDKPVTAYATTIKNLYDNGKIDSAMKDLLLGVQSTEVKGRETLYYHTTSRGVDYMVFIDFTKLTKTNCKFTLCGKFVRKPYSLLKIGSGLLGMGGSGALAYGVSAELITGASGIAIATGVGGVLLLVGVALFVQSLDTSLGSEFEDAQTVFISYMKKCNLIKDNDKNSGYLLTE